MKEIKIEMKQKIIILPEEVLESGDMEDWEESDTATESALVLDVLDEMNAKMDTMIWHLECLVALVFILVFFGTFKIARSWSKGVGLK